MTYSFNKDEIIDEEDIKLLVILASNCTKKFRDRIGKTLVGILNVEE